MSVPKQKPYSKKSKLPTTGPEKVEARHDFTADEWRSASNEHLTMLGAITTAKETRKAASSVAKSKIEEMQAAAGDLAEQLRNGYRMEPVDSLVEFDAKNVVKRFYRHCPGMLEHNEFIKQEAMTEDDFRLASDAAQEKLPLAEGKPEDKKPGDEPPMETKSAE
jgi:hypothetical protein